MRDDASNKPYVAKDKTEVIVKLPAACRSEEAAVAFMEAQRWGDKPACAHCESADVYQLRDRKTKERNKRFLWFCRDCKRQYTVRIGTVFEDSRIPLMYWCHAFWRACASKKGVSALQIKRETGLSYKSALFMMHRIRWAMHDDPKEPRKLRGIVEADETYVGGKPRNPSRRSYATRKDRKMPVFAIVERGGEVRSFQMDKVTTRNIGAAIFDFVSRDATIYTDSSARYNALEGLYKHEAVNHSKREYVRGTVHSNTIESYFAILKRGLMGTFHSVSRKHLHRYLSEFQYRYNTRKMDDGARTVMAIKAAQGKRLRYREPLDTLKAKP